MSWRHEAYLTPQLDAALDGAMLPLYAVGAFLLIWGAVFSLTD